jgi:UDP-glucuronate 4-epimerase
MKFVVTGAAGFIGSHLADALGAAGHDVVGVDSFTDYYDTSLKEENARGLDVRRIDLAEDDLDFAGFDGVFHLAGQPGVRSFGGVFPVYLRRNVLASQRVFEAAARDGVKVVFTSSSSVYGAAELYPTPEDATPHPLSPYGITKLACEHLADAYRRQFGLDCVVLRYFNAFGPRQRPDMAFTRIATALAEGGRFELFGDGTQSRSWTYVGDVVEASMNEAIALFESVSGARLDVLRHEEPVAGDQRRTRADTTRIRDELGWEPRVSLEDGIRAQWSWASARVTSA